jgi:hypothetical protein
MPRRTSFANRDACENRLSRPHKAPPIGIFDCPTPQELYKSVTEEYHRDGVTVEQERRRAATLVLATSSTFDERRVAPQAHDVVYDRVQHAKLSYTEELLSLAQKLSTAAENPAVSACELRVRSRSCLDAVYALESLTRLPVDL